MSLDIPQVAFEELDSMIVESFFTFIYEGQKGILGISEATNHFITILFPDEDDNE